MGTTIAVGHGLAMSLRAAATVDAVDAVEFWDGLTFPDAWLFTEDGDAFRRIAQRTARSPPPARPRPRARALRARRELAGHEVVNVVETGEAASQSTPHVYRVPILVRPEWGAYAVAWRMLA